MFVWQVQIYCQNSQSGVSIEFSNLIVVDVLVAEYQDSIKTAIPQIIELFHSSNQTVCEAAAEVFLKLSKQGKYPIL